MLWVVKYWSYWTSSKNKRYWTIWKRQLKYSNYNIWKWWISKINEDKDNVKEGIKTRVIDDVSVSPYVLKLDVRVSPYVLKRKHSVELLIINDKIKGISHYTVISNLSWLFPGSKYDKG